jgi:hypothetical protein
VLAWALGMAGLLAGALGASGGIAGPLIVAGGILLVNSGLLTVSGRGGEYRGRPITPFLGVLMIIIGVGWDVFGVAVAVGGW